MRGLRWLAALLVRGPNAEFVRHDLDEIYARDRARGMSAVRASSRYVRSTFASAISVWRGGRRVSIEPIVEWLREVRQGTFTQDLRFALRLFRKHPAPVAIAIGGLALAIGVVTSVFTIVDASLLRKFGMDDPATVRLVGLERHWYAGWRHTTFTTMQEATGARVEAAMPQQVQFSPAPAAAEAGTRRQLMFVSGGYLQMLGGRPSHGRALTPDDDRPASPPVAVVSHTFWQNVLQADPSAVGKTIWINGAAVTLVGVLRPEFTGPVPPDRVPSILAPFAAYDDIAVGQPSDAVSSVTVDLFARVPAGADVRAAQELTAIVNRSRRPPATPAEEAERPIVRFTPAATPLDIEGNKAESYVSVLFIFTIVGLVLAVACANIANLLLAAATTRTQEVGVRLAMGASRRRIMSQLVNESLLLGAFAGGLGFLFAVWFVPIAASMLPGWGESTMRPDASSLICAVAVALASGLAAGLSPARHGARGDVLGALKSESGATAAAAPSRLRTSFVGFQAAVSMLLLVVAALLARSAVAISQVSIGFDADRLVSVSVDRPRGAFDDVAYARAALAAARNVPTVERASVIYAARHDRFTYGGTFFELAINRTDAEYFSTAGLRLLRGRLFTSDDVITEAPVAVISDSVARTFFAGVDPVGRSLSGVPSKSGRQQEDATIIGVVADAMVSGFWSERFGAIYQPIKVDIPVPPVYRNPPALMIRSAAPRVAARAVAEALRQIDPQLAPWPQVVRDGIDAFLEGKRTLAWLAAPTALLAVLLAALGVFGVTAFVVGQRTREVSLRIALGASSADVLRLLMKDSVRPVAVGLVAGFIVAIGFSRLAAGELSGISFYDPVAVGSAAAILVAGATMAVLIPARRASKANPATLLRQI